MLEQVVPLVLLAVAGAGFVYAISIADTLRELRALEPITHPDLETWRCASTVAVQGTDAELKPNVAATQHPPGERSASCPPGARQARPQ